MTIYYQDEAVTLHLGRCEDVMPELEEGSCGLAFADLPYATTRNTWDRQIEPKVLWHEYNRILPTRGAAVLFGSGIFSARMVVSNEEAFRYTLVWDKKAITGFLNAKRQPLRAHEDILVFYRAQPYYDPQMIQTGRRSHSRGSRVDRTINHYGSFVNTPVPDEQDGQYPRSILSFAKPKLAHHPTQKPLDLCEWVIRSYAPPDSVVLDNVCGSGAALLAAVNAGRRAVGIEMEEKYCEMAASRLRARFTMSDEDWHRSWSGQHK